MEPFIIPLHLFANGVRMQPNSDKAKVCRGPEGWYNNKGFEKMQFRKINSFSIVEKNLSIRQRTFKWQHFQRFRGSTPL